MRRPGRPGSLSNFRHDAVAFHRCNLNLNSASRQAELVRNVVGGPPARAKQADDPPTARVEQLLSQRPGHV
jgi:hypothetical protein